MALLLLKWRQRQTVIGKWFEIVRDAKSRNLNYYERLDLRKKNYLDEEFRNFKNWMQKYSEKALPSDDVRNACEFVLK